MPEKIVLAIVFFLAGALLIGLSIPLILKKVPPNQLYGFRTQKTLSNPEIWYDANKRSGWYLLFAGLTIMVGTGIVWIAADRIATTTLHIIILPIILVPILIATLASLLYLKKL